MPMDYPRHHYNQWQPQQALFPLHAPNTIKHNITCLEKYYLERKNETQQQIFHNHHPQEQRQDPRSISLPTNIPLTNISITECNPSKDINTQTHTIQIQQNSAHIYDSSGKYLISIPTCRLTWLWNQYQNGLNTPLNLEPQTQSFETEVVWLY